MYTTAAPAVTLVARDHLAQPVVKQVGGQQAGQGVLAGQRLFADLRAMAFARTDAQGHQQQGTSSALPSTTAYCVPNEMGSSTKDAQHHQQHRQATAECRPQHPQAHHVATAPGQPGDPDVGDRRHADINPHHDQTDRLG
jgi:hypothetical protein